MYNKKIPIDIEVMGGKLRETFFCKKMFIFVDFHIFAPK